MSSKFSIVMQSSRNVVWRVAAFILKAIGSVLVLILPLGLLQITIEKHWALGFPMILLLAVAAYLGIRDFQSGNIRDLESGNVDTWQGILTLVSILSITVSVFAFLSFVLYRFEAARYEGFPTALLNESRHLISAFFSYYTWQLFEVIPGLKINEALGWSMPLQKSGFISGVLVLSFRVIIIFIVLDVFRKWWHNREARSTLKSNKAALVKD